MKANELMIGDWVTGKKWRENPFKLSRINDNGKYYYGITSDGTQVGPFLLEEIEPIPLTPEILEKSGFIRDEDDEESFHDKDCVLIKQSLGGYGVCLDKVRTVSGLFHYVHELQHALRLCGIEKEIVI